MPRPQRPAKSNLERLFESEGLTGESKKDLNLYPKLEQFPLPFPRDNPELYEKVTLMNEFAMKLDEQFRTMPVIFSETKKETPDVRRYNDVAPKKQIPYINYSRLPLELNPELHRIRLTQRLSRKRKLKRKLSGKELTEKLNRTKELIVDDTGGGRAESDEEN